MASMIRVMGVSKHLFTSAQILFLAFLCSNVAQGSLTLRSTRSVASTSGAQFVDLTKPEDSGKQLDKEEKRPERSERMARQYTGSSEKVETKYPFIYGTHDRLSAYLGKYSEHWYLDWKLWVGVPIFFGVWTFWLVYGGYNEENQAGEHYCSRALFAFGINIWILHHLQYSNNFKMGMLCVNLLLGFQAMFHSYMWSKSELADTKTQKDFHAEFQCETMYLDFTLPVVQIMVLFVAQCCVWWFYMTSILGNFQFDNVNYTFWLVAYLAMQMTMIFSRGADSVLGKPFPVHEVYTLGTKCDNITLKMKDVTEASMTPRLQKNQPFTVTKANIIMRGVLGFFCNAILREIMAYTLPLMLMGFAEPMDFVVYCVGANFITTVDDMKERVFEVKEIPADDEEAIKSSTMAKGMLGTTSASAERTQS